MNIHSNRRGRHVLAAAGFGATLALLAACGSGDDAPAQAPLSTLEQVKAFLASDDARVAKALPATGAQMLENNDSCYLHDGESKAFLVSSFDEDPSATAARVGVEHTNIKITGDRETKNSDGSARHEVDVTYDIAYKDGTTNKDAKQTLVTGSTQGTCATPTNSTVWRYLGNQKIIRAVMQARNLYTAASSIANGSPINETYRREIRIDVRDPGQVATYVVVSGPGPAAADGKPFSWKMISPRILRDDPLLAGKVGNASYRDTDGFYACNVNSSSVTVAELANCANPGAVYNTWGSTATVSPGSSATTTLANLTDTDTRFGNIGWVAGGTFTFAVYADDGWKTVNGQSGKTPIATYTATLNRLPYKLVDMAASGSYPKFVSSTLSPSAVAAAFTGLGGTTTVSFSPAKAPNGGLPLALNDVYVFQQGTNLGAAVGSSWPRTRQIKVSYPGPLATSATVDIKGKHPNTTATSYGEITAEYNDRNNGWVLMLGAFQ